MRSLDRKRKLNELDNKGNFLTLYILGSKSYQNTLVLFEARSSLYRRGFVGNFVKNFSKYG